MYPTLRHFSEEKNAWYREKKEVSARAPLPPFADIEKRGGGEASPSSLPILEIKPKDLSPVSPQSPKTQLQGGGTAQDPSPSFQCPIFLLAHPPFPTLCTDSCLCACESVLYAQSPQELTPNPTTILPLREREGRDEPYSTITSNPSFLRPFDLLR